MQVEIRVPEVGESIREGTLVEWYIADGAVVAPDDPLFELETDKITLTVAAEQGGRVSLRVPADTPVQVGQVVGVLDTEGQAAAAEPGASVAAAAPACPVPTPDAPPAAEHEAPAPAPPMTEPAGFDQLQAKLEAGPLDALLSPAARRLLLEEGVDPAGITGSAPGGRITKEDVLAHQAAQTATGPQPPARTPAATPAPAPAQPPAPRAALPTPPARSRTAAPTEAAPRETRRHMSRLRQRIAERLVMAQQTAAILTTFNEADLSQVLALRKLHRDAFEKRHGVRLGMMSFFIKALVDALKTVPALNARIEGDEVVEQHYYDIGVAVGTERGLVVPVIRNADQLSFAGIESQIKDFAVRAKTGKLTLDELTGGCFTVSNGGVYGSLLSTPILNPPQSGVLGLHAIKKRPVVVDDEIAIRPMMYLAMSYDHRLVDGTQAVTFLKRIVDCVEHPERLMLEV